MTDYVDHTLEIEAELSDVVKKEEGRGLILVVNGDWKLDGESIGEQPWQNDKRGMSLRFQSFDERPDTFGIPPEDRHKLIEMLTKKKVRIKVEIMY